MNKIKVTYESEEQNELIEIIRAEYSGDYRIHLWFNDGKDKVVDLGSFLRNARNPLFKKYLDPDEFKKFKIIYGDNFLFERISCSFCYCQANPYPGK